MSQLPNTSSATSAAAAATAANKSNSAGTASNRFNEVGVEDFLKLMFAELQNQDPLNPTDNNQLMAQIGQIREITATDKLTSTLDSVLLGQNVASATNLIGAEVDGLSDDRQNITGVRCSVTVSGGGP